MFKIRNPTEKKEIDTEFWLEEKNGSILLKAKRIDQKQDFIIVEINKDGLFVCDGFYEDLGFKIIKRSGGFQCIDVHYSYTS